MAEFEANYDADVGDRKTIKEIAATFDKVYGFQPKLERLGSLDELKVRMLSMQAQNPTDVYRYIPL